MSQERTRTICALGMRGVGQLSQEALHALVVFPARFGPWVLAAARGTSAAAGEPPAVNAQSSGPRTFTCSMSCSDWELAGECSCGQLSDILPQCL